MTASLFDFLLATMPLAGVRGAIEANTQSQMKFDECSAADLRKLLRYIPHDQDYTALVPPVKTAVLDKEQTQQQLWGWTHKAAEPAKITDVFCRVRDADYAPYKVLDSIEWGIDDPAGTFKNAVRITNAAGVAVELPLTQRFVHWKWVAVAGYLPEDATPLWRLTALHDRSIVLAFVYDLDPTTSEPKPMRETAKSDSDRAAELDQIEQAARELTPEGAQKSNDADFADDLRLEPSLDDGTRAPITELPWVPRIRQDQFMERYGAESVVQGEVGDQCLAKTGAARVLVALCLTVCRERSDFEPGGVVGAARMYPHLMVWANIPLAKIEASIRYDRPERTTKQNEGLPTSGHDCCKDHDAMDPTINCLLVADANPTGSKIAAMLPFWSNMFAYYRTEAFSHFPQQRIRAVRTDRRNRRENNDGWILRDIVGDFKITVKSVNKEPRQRAFDNIHMAPKMKLVGVSKMTFQGPLYLPPAPGEPNVTYPVDRYAMGLDDISMAPFCAHDCFHTHWRWGATATAKWTLGWDATGPYKLVGAPMVPVNQDVDIWLRGKNAFTYHVTVTPKRRDLYIMPGDCQVLMHHGSSYAVGITGAMLVRLAKTAFGVLAPPPWFLDESGRAVLSTNSWAMMYWWERLFGELTPASDGAVPGYVIRERTTMTDEGLRKAMDL